MNAKKIIIIDPVHPYLIKSLKNKFSLVNYFPDISYKKLSNIIKKYNIIILRSGLKLDKNIIQKAKSLNLIARAGVGMDNIDLIEAKKNKIKYFNVPSQSSLSVAEHVFGLIFSAARKINHCDALLRKNVWKKKEMYGFELSHKNLGIIGLGKIGTQIAGIGKKFNMKIYANVKNNSEKRKNILKKKNIFLISLKQLLKVSDFIAIAVPLGNKTINLINRKNLSTLKKNCILVNISRGGVVNEDHLYEILKKKKYLQLQLMYLKKKKNLINFSS